MDETCEKDQVLREEILQTRAEVMDVLLETDDVNLQQIPSINAEYACRIGCFENELLKAQIGARRSRKRLDLAQARANAAKQIDAHAIEERLDVELEDWQRQLKERIEAYATTMARKAQSVPLTPSEEKEMKSLHRTLIRRLHPDVNPGEKDVCLLLFKTAQTAYSNGDLEALRSLEVSTRGMGSDAASRKDDLQVATEDELSLELDATRAQLAVLRERLDDIKSRNPYALREWLEDSPWVTERVSELMREIDKQHEVARAFDQRYRHLVAEGDTA